MPTAGAPTADPLAPRRPLRLALAVSSVALALAFWGADLGRVSATVLSVRWEYLLLAVALDLAVFLTKALKWRLIVLPLRRLPVRTLFSGIAVGALVSNVLPFRLDELVRAAYLGRRGGVPRAAALGTIVVERIVDTAALLCAVLVLLGLFGWQAGLGLGGAVALALLVGAGTLALVLTHGGRRLAAALARRAPAGLAARSASAVADLVTGLRAFPRGRRLAAVCACAGGEWALTIVYMTLVLAAFSVRLPLAGVLLLVAAGYLSFAVPSGPGGLGVFELLVKGSLVAGSRVDPHIALGLALTLHALLITPISLLGAAALVREGLTVAELRQTQSTAAATRVESATRVEAHVPGA